MRGEPKRGIGKTLTHETKRIMLVVPESGQCQKFKKKIDQNKRQPFGIRCPQIGHVAKKAELAYLKQITKIIVSGARQSISCQRIKKNSPSNFQMPSQVEYIKCPTRYITVNERGLRQSLLIARGRDAKGLN